MFRGKIRLVYFSLILSIVNLLLYHIPFYKFVCDKVDLSTFNGVWILVSLTILAIILNGLVFYIILYSLRSFGKWLLSIFFVFNSIAFYFVDVYNVLIDRSMMGNVFNTNVSEAGSFFSLTFVLYLILLGVLPAFFIIKIDTVREVLKKFVLYVSVTLVFLLSFAYVNSSNWLWIDRHSTELGALVMPWSYVVNSVRYYNYQHHKNKEQILLPDATVNDTTESVVVLVIGESARKANFSLYGYDKNTNPLLSKVDDLHVYPAESSATYTTAGVKAILEHKSTGELYEILPNYLFRNGVEVVWRTTNWGEPTVKIDKYQKKEDLMRICTGDECEYDGILLSGIKEQILKSNKNKVLVILHTSTSHGPTYYKKYPPRFDEFKPVCKSVELSKCTQEELINAYDNTILYTDYLLATLIDTLKTIDGYRSSMIFISDHGESLGEKNLYMHGVPMSIAPKEQYEIPFIVWTSDSSITWKQSDMLSQHYVFHTILDLLSISSPIYNKEMSLVDK